MTDKTRIKIAVIVTALFLAGISTIGLAMRKQEPATAGTTAPAAAALTQAAAPPAAQPARYAEQEDGDEYERNESESREEPGL